MRESVGFANLSGILIQLLFLKCHSTDAFIILLGFSRLFPYEGQHHRLNEVTEPINEW